MLLDVHFQRVPDLRSPALGVLWGRLKSDLPHVEIHEPLEPEVERFDDSPPSAILNLEISRLGPPLRFWMLDDRRETVLQVQPDRIIQNWRKLSAESEYPRYEPLRDRFLSYLGSLQTLADEYLGDTIRPVQCEVTYLNHIDGALDWIREVRVLRGLEAVPGTVQGIGMHPEQVSFSQRFSLRNKDNEPFGRAFVEVQPAADDAWVLKLTVRGRPVSPDNQGVANILNAGREWIVTTFDRLTSDEAKTAWGKER